MADNDVKPRSGQGHRLGGGAAAGKERHTARADRVAQDVWRSRTDAKLCTGAFGGHNVIRRTNGACPHNSIRHSACDAFYGSQCDRRSQGDLQYAKARRDKCFGQWHSLIQSVDDDDWDDRALATNLLDPGQSNACE